ncbi:MAG: type II toxin-antitoxin system VapC family toxin [Pseudomonadota bacterium]
MKPVYLLDTCILAEPIRPQPSSVVLERLRETDGLQAMPAVVWHELLFGMNRLPEGARKRRLQVYLLDVVAPSIPVLPYDDHAAWLHADFRAVLESRGQPLPLADSMIAAIARANNCVLITRNVQDFLPIPHLLVENWFEEPPG